MSNVFKLNEQGIRGLMQSSEMQAVLMEYAQQVQARAGEGYGISPYVGQTRANVSVFAETKEAYQDNMENNTLLKALGV